MSAAPDLSLVIPAVTRGDSLDRCLASVEGQPERDRIEVIVVSRRGAAADATVARRFPGVHLVARPPGTPIPQLRRDGIALARAPLVAVTEDHVIAPAGWLAALLQSGGRAAVVGGPLVNGCTARVVDWAAFFCEYSMFVPPAEGRSHLIPGNNVVYTRSALEDARDLIDAGAWDMALHARLEELGRGRWMEPAMTLVHQRSFGFREFLVLRFHFARAFAGARVPARQRWRRMALAAGTPLLPAVLLARIARVVVGRGYHGSALARSLPVLMIFLTSGAIGELCGYVLGAGASGRKVE